MTSSLGMGEGSSGANSLVSAGSTFKTSMLDIMINGQALGAIYHRSHGRCCPTTTKLITKSAFNVVAENVGNGITGGDGVETFAGNYSKTFTVSDSDLAIGDVIEINGTDVTLQAATVADLVTRINAPSTTGITATASGNDVTLTGTNVTSVTIGYKTKAEIEAASNATTTTVDVSGSASDAISVDVVLNAADAVVGRTYSWQSRRQPPPPPPPLTPPSHTRQCLAILTRISCVVFVMHCLSTPAALISLGQQTLHSMLNPQPAP